MRKHLTMDQFQFGLGLLLLTLSLGGLTAPPIAGPGLSALAPTPLNPARRPWSWTTPANQPAGSSTRRYTTRSNWFG
jgi:hypothetical protein